ncbi:1,4-dihydroxy-2-naphthoate octaprenyltransferase [Prevotella sp. oral taxon 317]|uniref:1,4-dihydroxy-2-naphthoate octaprenyltransferase n=1 Tax=Prevotella sp. oral taxon 317 TaxID=652721 RepID=UPI0001C403A1|nr:1,4-dihydroxy-2-naphthoate octaprenyltransferase [Prevotella sp. oral taxon 317]EFC69258.1 1,4-dihydroxy-2-naphthoate octaprenyltransferase [Prevotella sp. oral taxon 317 str. F0108]
MNTNKTIKTNSAKAWLLAARPKTLTGAAVPVLLGAMSAYLKTGNEIRLLPIVFCFLFAFVMQIDANFVNDYFDFRKGNDNEKRLGPKRACAQGWITPAKMKCALYLTTLLACLIGLPLIFFGGWITILVGLVCVVFCFLYTTHLSYKGMGDVLVLVFFGLVPVYGTYVLALPHSALSFSAEPFALALACGFVIDTLLIVNNFRDIENDIEAGKRTLAVRLGIERTLWLYLFVGLFAILLSGFAFILAGHYFAFAFSLCYIPLHIKTFNTMKAIRKGKALNKVLGKTAANITAYGVATAIGMLFDTMLR